MRVSSYELFSLPLYKYIWKFCCIFRCFGFFTLIGYIFYLTLNNHPLPNIDKNILEIPGKNRNDIEITLTYFSTNQLKTQNKNILENSARKLINRKIFRLQNR